MSDDWKKCICQQPVASRISDLTKFFCEVEIEEENRTPIDHFYFEIKKIIDLGKPDVLSANPEIASFLLVAGISATENYFREIFSRIIKICPKAQACSGEKSILLSSAIWHGKKDIERGAFENYSLASSDSIIKASKNYLSYNIENDVGKQIFDEFERLCQLRHNIVHSSGVIAGKNAISLGLPASTKRLKVFVGFKELHESLSICSSLVIGSNNYLFLEMCKRWAVEWPKMPSWKKDDEYSRFKGIWGLFFSAIDLSRGAIEKEMSVVKCKNNIKKTFNL